MDFRILGPLEVIENGESLDLGTFKQRSLLALLLINANRVVSTDRILEELWGDEAAGKQNALWVYVSRLRSVLEPDRSDNQESNVLVTRDHGYTLIVDPDRVDAARFEALLAEGRALLQDQPASASRVIQDALDRWRGSALEDFEYEEFSQAEVTRLEELRRGATEDRFEADLRSGKAGELVGDLEVLCRQTPLRERPVRHLMLALYWSGRQADALRAFERFRGLIGEELGIEPSPELASLEEQILLHDERVRPPSAVDWQATPASRLETPNPFKGLRAFAEDDAETFFGRDRIVAEAVRKLAANERLVALVGPSGSGKSSVAHAGLIPALRKGAIRGSDTWLFADMVPGAYPFAEVEAALLRSTIDPPDSLAEQLGSGEDGLLRAVLRVLPTSSSRLVLLIDQFEELFVLTVEEPERRRFLDNLLLALDDPHGRLLVALTLRADFYDRPLASPEFGARLGAGVVNVVPMTADELEVAARAPATLSGVTLGPALVAQLLTDVVGEPGTLPLFQYALTDMFDRRTGDHLNLASYESLGGVRGALGRRAEELYQQLDGKEQAAAQQLFLRLVTIAESDEWNRRRVHASELVSLDVDIVAIQAVIEAFGSHRLLTLDRDNVSGTPTVEVAHEALLKDWDRLRKWIDESRVDIGRHAALSAATRDWADAGNDSDYLFTGSRLSDYEQWALHTDMKLTESERGFIDAARDRRSLQDSEEEARRAGESRLRRRAKVRLLAAVAAVGALLLAIAVPWLTTNKPDQPPTTAGVAGGVVPGTDSGSASDGTADAPVIGGVAPADPAPIAVISGGRGDPRSDLPLSGFDRAVNDFGVQGDEAIVGENTGSLERALRLLSEERKELIVVPTGFTADAPLHAVAPDFPETRYVVVDVLPVDLATGEPWRGLPNVTYFVFNEHEGSYLVGAAAALKSETGSIGFIGGAQFPLIQRYEAGFVAGARSVRPDVGIDIVYLSEFGGEAFANPAFSKAAATDMYRDGVDVIYAVSGPSPFGNTGVFDAASTESDNLGIQLWAIGADIDEQEAVLRMFPDQYSSPALEHSPEQWSGHILTSALKPFDDAVYLALERYSQGDLAAGVQSVAMDYSTSGGFVDDFIPQLDAIKEEIRTGEIEVPPVPGR